MSQAISLRHPRRAHLTSLPLLRSTRPLTFSASLVAFISDPTPSAYIKLERTLDLVAIAMQVQRGTAYLVQIQSARRVMVAILERVERIGVLAVSTHDAQSLRAAAPHIAAAIGCIRLDAFCFANAIVQHKMQLQGAVLAD
ncbi:MAG: hypothetical protein ACN6OP_04510 [Pseudomonadales bacterium]|uniref:hypothetical protein n=1 Tax=Cupriavidus sp. TaxID=1873897 RepID=UPI003D0C36D7